MNVFLVDGTQDGCIIYIYMFFSDPNVCIINVYVSLSEASFKTSKKKVSVSIKQNELLQFIEWNVSQFLATSFPHAEVYGFKRCTYHIS